AERYFLALAFRFSTQRQPCLSQNASGAKPIAPKGDGQPALKQSRLFRHPAYLRKSRHHRQISRLKESLCQRPAVRHAHAQLFHQSRREKPQPFAPRRTPARQKTALKSHSAEKQIACSVHPIIRGEML